MENDSLKTIEIDLNVANRGELNEGYMRALGAQIQFLYLNVALA